MALTERQLEEDEARLDNILHKIVESARRIQLLREHIALSMPREEIEQMLHDIDTLAKIIENLGTLADEIDITDERLTRQVQENVEGKLGEAIAHILEVERLLQRGGKRSGSTKVPRPDARRRRKKLH